jgi:hypothetical protein
MCECVNTINEDLKPNGQMLNIDLLSNRPMITLVRVDKWISENRRGKHRAIFASFCPWCGEKYPEKDSALPAKPADIGKTERNDISTR